MRRKLVFPLLLATAVASCRSESPEARESGGGIGGADGEESFVLYSEGAGRDQGMVVLMTEEMKMEAGKFRMETPQGEFEGTVEIDSIKELRLENESDDKVRATLLSKEVIQKMVMNGQEMPQPPQPKPLVGVPLVVTLTDAGWEAVREDGEEPAELEVAEIRNIVKKVGKAEEKNTYGTKARKPGDTWEVEATEMLMIEDSGEVDGSIKLHFDEVADHQGMRCAFLSGTMDVRGGPPSSTGVDSGSMEVAGSFRIIRSLEHQIDLMRELDATMTVRMETPAGTLTMSGPTTVTEKAEIEP